MRIDTRPHTVTDCSLCRRLHGNRLLFPRLVGQDPGLDLILPETTNRFVPWFRLTACGHCYHAHCLARLNPSKYTNIEARNPDGTHDLIQVDEYDCLDCAGTQLNNSTFNPSIPSGHRIDIYSDYTNSNDVFQEAEHLVDIYNHRKANLRQRVLLTTILDPMDYTRHSITTALDQMSVRLRIYATCNPNARPLPDPVHFIPSSYIFYQNGHRLNPRMPYSTLLDRVTVDFDWDKLFTKELNIRQICETIPTVPEKIRRMNEAVEAFKRCREGTADVTDLEMEPYVAVMVHAPTEREDPLCVLNRHGQRKRFVVFDDFPITENTGVCSVSGGTRKYAPHRYRRKSMRQKQN